MRYKLVLLILWLWHKITRPDMQVHKYALAIRPCGCTIDYTPIAYTHEMVAYKWVAYWLKNGLKVKFQPIPEAHNDPLGCTHDPKFKLPYSWRA